MGFLLLGCVNAVFLFTLLVLVKVYAVLTLGKCQSKRKLDGKTAIVTGANRGIGYETALNFAKRGARVIITSENEKDLPRARNKLIGESGNKNIVVKFLDLRSFEIIRNFAKDILDTEERLDILVNNAGVGVAPRKKTQDGLLIGLQINYFGPFLLTNLLLGLMRTTGSARIVNVASVMSNIGIGFDKHDITMCRFPMWYDVVTYCNSKRLVVCATKEMANRLEGSGVTANCLHPGAVYTNIFQDTRIWLLIFVANILGPLYMKTPEEGIETSVHLSVCESIEGVSGEYFSDCKKTWIWGDLSDKTCKEVWDQTVALVHLKPEEMHYNKY